jgi:hypothetical protein
MENLRKPLLFVALILITLVVLVELGATALLGSVGTGARNVANLIPESGDVREAYEDVDPDELEDAMDESPPGLGVPTMALVDGLLLFTVGLIAVSLLWGERIHARFQGIATLIFSLLVLIASIGLIIVALSAVILMISLLLAVPFGTLAYLAIYGFFNRGGAVAALGILMTLKLGFAICLVLAHQRFLQNKGLLLIILTSLLANVIVSFLHAFVPGFLVSITDGIAAIIVGILAALWALFLLIGSLPAVLKALRFDRV